MTATPPSRGAPAVLRSVVVAFGFLTRLPVPTVEWRDDDLRRSLPAFPLVGLVVGGLAAAIYAGAWQVLSPVPSAVLAVAAAVAVTGAFHEDGLADTFDGFFGGYVSRPADPTSSGAAVAEPAGPAGLVVGGLTTLVPVGLLLGPAAAVPIVAATAVTLAWIALAHHRVGGITGDVLGATNQLVHIATMACVVALARAEWS